MKECSTDSPCTPSLSDILEGAEPVKKLDRKEQLVRCRPVKAVRNAEGELVQPPGTFRLQLSPEFLHVALVET